jgi:rare lipoprotein A
MLSIRCFGILGICVLSAAHAEIPLGHQISNEVPTVASPLQHTAAAVDNTSGDADFKPVAQALGPAGIALPSGEASWYASKFQGRRTASGERFNGRAFTAAHRTLPPGTYVRVTLLATGKSVIVRINDRGPFVRGRIIDLSYAAAQALGLPRVGFASRSPANVEHQKKEEKRKARRPDVLYDWSSKQLMLGGVNPSELVGNAKNGSADLKAGSAAAPTRVPYMRHDNK